MPAGVMLERMLRAKAKVPLPAKPSTTCRAQYCHGWCMKRHSRPAMTVNPTATEKQPRGEPKHAQAASHSRRARPPQPRLAACAPSTSSPHSSAIVAAARASAFAAAAAALPPSSAAAHAKHEPTATKRFMMVACTMVARSMCAALSAKMAFIWYTMEEASLMKKEASRKKTRSR